jgi:hypothetical protein
MHLSRLEKVHAVKTYEQNMWAGEESMVLEAAELLIFDLKFRGG